MGFPPSSGSGELAGAGGRGAGSSSAGLAGGVGRLFDAIRDPKTGETYSSSKIARMSPGDLGEEDVKGLRSGSVTDPPLSHVVGLARAFGVEPSYLVDGYGGSAKNSASVGRGLCTIWTKSLHLLYRIPRQRTNPRSREPEDG